MMVSNERVLKNRVYVLIFFLFVYFFGAVKVLEPYKETIDQQHGFVIFLGLVFIAVFCLISEFLVYKLIKKVIYSK